jgi:hypothetical protein
MFQNEPVIEPDSEFEMHRSAQTSAALNESALGEPGDRHPAVDRAQRRGGKLGSSVSEFTVERLAGALELDTSQVYRWARRRLSLPVQKAIALSEIARSVGTNLSLEDIYETEVIRIRVRMRLFVAP